MANSNEPTAEQHVLAALATSLSMKFEDLQIPVLQAKSFFSGTQSRISQVDDIITKSDLSSELGFFDCLKLVGGLVAVAEGLSIAANAPALGLGLASALGVASVSPAIATVVAVGLFVFGAYLLLKGAAAIGPFLINRLKDKLYEEWTSLSKS